MLTRRAVPLALLAGAVTAIVALGAVVAFGPGPERPGALAPVLSASAPPTASAAPIASAPPTASVAPPAPRPRPAPSAQVTP